MTRPSRSSRPGRGKAAPPRAAPLPAARPPLLARLAQATPWKPALALAVLHLLLAAGAFNPMLNPGGDNAAYIGLARSLVQHHAYLELWDPAALPHTQYPPVWPALIALLSLFGAESLIGIKLLVMAISVVCIALAYLWMRRVSTPGVALAAGLVLAFSPGVLDLSHWELSDVPAWAFTLLALWASAQLARPGEEEVAGAGAPPTHQRRWLALLVAGVVLGNFTRSAGLPLVVAALAWFAWRREWRRLAVLGAAYLPLAVAWWLRGSLYGAPGYTSYLWAVDPYRPDRGAIGLSGMLERVAINFDRYLHIHLPMLLSWQQGRLLGAALLILAVAGWFRRLKRPGLAEFWVPLYAGLLLVWPSAWSGERFILPLLPLLLCYAFEWLQALVTTAGGGRQAVLAPALAAGALLAIAVPGIVEQERLGGLCRGGWRNGDRWMCMTPVYADYFRIAEQTRGRLPPGSAVMSRKATLFYLVGGYPGRTYPLSADPDTFFAAAKAAGARYVVVDALPDLAPIYLHPVLVKARGRFCSFPDLRIQHAALLRIEPPTAIPLPPADTFRVCDQPLRPAATP